jgi:hypothetical protein
VGGPFRYTLATGRYERGAPGPARVDGFTDTGTLLYETIGCAEDATEPANASCRIDTLPPPAYAPTRAPLR